MYINLTSLVQGDLFHKSMTFSVHKSFRALFLLWKINIKPTSLFHYYVSTFTLELYEMLFINSLFNW